MAVTANLARVFSAALHALEGRIAPMLKKVENRRYETTRRAACSKAVLLALVGCTLFLSCLQCCGSFSYVYIPCDASLPMEEWRLEPRQSNEIGCLTEHLQQWFGKHGELSPDARATFKNHLRMNIKERGLGKEAEEALDKDEWQHTISGMETVEIVTLLPPIAENGYITVSMYVDDRGLARNLPRNDRATSLMLTVSNRAGPVVGDAFLGRAYDNENDGFARLDLKVDDVASGAGWVKLCSLHKAESDRNRDRVEASMRAIKDKKDIPETEADRTIKRKVEEERLDLETAMEDENDPLLRDGHATFPAKCHPPLLAERACCDAAAEIRQRGNEAYNNADYKLAVRKYGKALRYALHCVHLCMDTPDKVSEEEKRQLAVACEMNLAQACFKLRRFSACQDHCQALLRRDPNNVKALYRLACAQREEGDTDAARGTLSKASTMAPDDKIVARALRELDARERAHSRQSAALAKNMFGKGFGNLYPEAPAPKRAQEEDDIYNSGDRMDDGDEDQERAAEVESSKGQPAAHPAKQYEDFPPGYADDAELEKALRGYGQATREAAGEATPDDEEEQVQAALAKLKQMRDKNMAEGRQWDVEAKVLGEGGVGQVEEGGL